MREERKSFILLEKKRPKYWAVRRFCGSVNRFAVFMAVESIQHDLLQFGNQWITRVSASALVVEGVFRQLVHSRQEVSFLHAGFTDGCRDAQLGFQFIQPSQQLNDFLLSAVTRCAQPEMVGDFSLAAARLRVVVLAESCLLGWGVICVVANDIGNQHGIGQPVRDMKF